MWYKRSFHLVVFLLLIGLTFSVNAAPELALTAEEERWLIDNRHRAFSLGLEMDAGTDFFVYQGKQQGYLLPTVRLMHQQLGLNLQIIEGKHWAEVYDGLQQGSIDILFGANDTPERRQFMAFTRSMQEYPYAVFTLNHSDFHTLGDLKGKKIGYLSGDYIISAMQQRYPNVTFTALPYPSKDLFFQALIRGEVDAVITVGAEIIHTCCYQYPETKLMLVLKKITSDKTLSARKENQVLVNILDKFIRANLNGEIRKYQQEAQQLFNRKILNLTEQESAWLEENHTVRVGISDDYLPYEYYGDGEFKGITGAWLNKIHELTGIRFEAVQGSFGDLLAKVKDGEIEIMDVARTESRMNYLIFGTPYDTGRDIILGRLNSDPVNSINDLEGKTIPVVKNFWQKEYLYANLSDNVKIIETNSVSESMELLRAGKADYMIDNPTVIQYHLEGLGYNDLAKRGETTADSYLYLGVGQHQPLLASIMNKAMQRIDPLEMRVEGLRSAPRIQDLRGARLKWIILLLAVCLAAILLYVIRLVRQSICNKVEMQLHLEREAQLKTDALTGLGNRAAFLELSQEMDSPPFPQAIIITDLNNLKQINDNYGHSMGDELLIKYASALKQHTENKPVFRMGGDEFLLLLPDCDEAAAKVVLQQIETTLSQNGVLLPDGQTIIPSAAVGCTIRYSAATSLRDAIIAADNQMYELKRHMKGC